MQGQLRRTGDPGPAPSAQRAPRTAGAVAPQPDGDGLPILDGKHRHAPVGAVPANALRLDHPPVRHLEGVIAYLAVRGAHGLGKREVEPVGQVRVVVRVLLDEELGRSERRVGDKRPALDLHAEAWVSVGAPGARIGSSPSQGVCDAPARLARLVIRMRSSETHPLRASESFIHDDPVAPVPVEHRAGRRRERVDAVLCQRRRVHEFGHQIAR